MTALATRPRVGRLVVPYMVDATRSPIDFKALETAHVDECAERGRCGICGSRIRRGPIAFIGPADLVDRDWRSLEGVPAYRPGQMAMALAYSWRSHRDAFGQWHFQAIGEVTRDVAAAA